MQFRFVTTLLAVSAIAYAGCAAHTDQVEGSAETNEALKFHAPELVGAYTLATGFTGDFTHLVLKSDGSFFNETDIECITVPCNNPRQHGKWSSTQFSPTQGLGSLTLSPVGAAKMHYVVSLAGDHRSMKLTHSTTESASLYNRVGTFCDMATDCAGQPVPAMRMMCRVGDTMQTVCVQESHSCVAKCAPKPECTVDADCRLVDDYCTGCDCRSLSSSTPDPVCAGPGVRCLREPCGGRTATCDAGKCAVN
jgi:hypothetical protein